MKKPTKSTSPGALQSLGLVFLMFFAMAFQCKSGSDTSQTSPTGPSDRNGSSAKSSKGGGFCTTEQEFKAYIIADKSNAPHDYELKTEVIFHSFEVGAPRPYQNLAGGRFNTVTDNAYPVKTSYDVITRNKPGSGYGPGIRKIYVNARYMCYPVQWSDGPNCVCWGLDRSALAASEESLSEEEK